MTYCPARRPHSVFTSLPRLSLIACDDFSQYRLLVDRARGAQTLIEESPSSSPEYTQDEIAAMVGSVREVVQRALKTLDHAGLIQMARGRIQIIDFEALEGWSESESMNALATPAEKVGARHLTG